jgi:hypothetical protein
MVSKIRRVTRGHQASYNASQELPVGRGHTEFVEAAFGELARRRHELAHEELAKDGPRLDRIAPQQRAQPSRRGAVPRSSAVMVGREPLAKPSRCSSWPC